MYILPQFKKQNKQKKAKSKKIYMPLSTTSLGVLFHKGKEF